MSTFLYLSLLSMAAGVVVNLYVAHLDDRGGITEGDMIDRLCRWMFPAVYIGLNVTAAVYFIFFE